MRRLPTGHADSYNRRHRRHGVDLKMVEERVMEIFDVDRDVIYSRGGHKVQVEARSLLCYWAVRELGHSAADLAKRLSMTQPAVGYAVNRGEKIAKARKFYFLL